MRDLTRWGLAVALALVVPIVPFVAAGDRIEPAIRAAIDGMISRPAMAAAVVAVLAVDVVLPVPSSFVSTLAGARLGIVWGAAVVWLGMTAGALAAFALARLVGPRLARRLAGPGELAQMERLAERHGAAALVVCRPVPVLAEASVLLFAAVGLPWRRFFAPVALSNLGVAAVYATLGHYARENENLIAALAASMGVPLLASLVMRRMWPVEVETPARASDEDPKATASDRSLR